MRNRRLKLLLILTILIIGASAIVIQTLLEQSPPCGNSTGLKSTILRSTLTGAHFGGVWKYQLPPGRLPNAITVASDGSVWFGEQNLPGIGHILPNATLLEYKWPFQYPGPSFSTFIWGIAIWKGCVWASDQADSQLVAVDPSSGLIRTVKLAAESFPYTLTIGPNNDSLWFTEVFASKIGRIDDQFNLHEYSLPLAGTPGQIIFANDTLGYYVDTGNVGIVKPGVFSFNPDSFSPTQVGPEVNLTAPTSLALASNCLFVAQHATSIVAAYSFSDNDWVFYPTSPISYGDTTLPYFVATNGSQVWFNEHYANRMATLDFEHQLLTEYGLSNPPSNKRNGIDNVLTFALGDRKVWFTALTGNFVGYIDATNKPPFTISQPASSSIKLRRGGNITLTFAVSGVSLAPLTVQFADSESNTGQPKKILMTTNVTEIQSSTGQSEIVVNVKIGRTLAAGKYMLLVSVTDGLISQGAYVTLQVTA
jgi:streptogramin lyase